MSGHARFTGASRQRAAIEAGLAVFLLILLLRSVPAATQGGVPRPAILWPALGIGMVYAGYFGTLLGSVRMQRAGGRAQQRLWRELAGGAAVVLASFGGALLAHLVGALWTGDSGASSDLLRSPHLAEASALAAAMAFAPCRAAVLAWPIWDRLRRTRLLWSLTHGQLIGSLILAASVAVFSTAVTGGNRFGPFDPEGVAGGSLSVWLVTRVLPSLTDAMVVGIAASAILLPMAALISLLVLRRTTRRLEALAAATGALRAGDLTARVPVEGEDEVGRLQGDFNAMATDLERTLCELRAERDRVAGLLEARRQLVASVSHELRTRVATIRGYIESALKSFATSHMMVPLDVASMARETTRLQRLIEDLFALSRAEVGRIDLCLQLTDVRAVVRRLVDTTAPLAWQQRRVQVLAEAALDVPLARADAERLEQVVSNLLGNAVRHTQSGGLVAVVVDSERDSVRVDVRDTGEGIAATDLPRVFERFYRGPDPDGEQHEGAGLGLAIVKELVEAMGGTVEAASMPGEGSCFSIRLPRA